MIGFEDPTTSNSFSYSRDLEVRPGNEHGVYGLGQVVGPFNVYLLKMRVLPCPFRNVLAVKLAPNLANLEPAEYDMTVRSSRIESEMSVRLLDAMKPTEEQEKISLPHSVVEKVSRSLLGLTEQGQPSRLSITISANQVWVEVAKFVALDSRFLGSLI